jgi:hypothetical protein
MTTRLRPEALHVVYAADVTSQEPLAGRRYTLTHSDSTGELFLTIGKEYDRAQISGWYTRLMRDEVLSEWRQDEAGGPALHVSCHVSGGIILGGAGMRYAIFQRELPLVLEALRFGDRALFEAHPALDAAPIVVHFRYGAAPHDRQEGWGTPGDYR